MITCPNGHENQDGATYCSVCHAYISTTTPAPTPPPPPPPPPVEKLTIALTSAEVAVQMGAEASITALVTNLTDAVQECVLELTGPSWATLEPWLLKIEAQSTAETTLLFRPPAGAPDASPAGFTVKATLSADPASSAHVEGTCALLPGAQLDARIEPETSSGITSGMHSIAVTNPGGAPVVAKVVATEPSGALDLQLASSSLQVAAGADARATITVRPRARLSRGAAPVQHPFDVEVAAQGGHPITLHAAFEQRAPSWKPLIIAAAALIAIVIGIVAAAAGDDEVTQPTIEFVTVPNVIALSRADAAAVLNEAGFVVDFVGRGFRVQGMSPAPGSEAEKGSTVTLDTGRLRFPRPTDLPTLVSP